MHSGVYMYLHLYVFLATIMFVNVCLCVCEHTLIHSCLWLPQKQIGYPIEHNVLHVSASQRLAHKLLSQRLSCHFQGLTTSMRVNLLTCCHLAM